MLSVPRTHNRFADRSFTAAGPRLWNKLPADLRWPNLTFPVFRQKLKTYLCGLVCSWDLGALWLFCTSAPYKYSLCTGMYVCKCAHVVMCVWPLRPWLNNLDTLTWLEILTDYQQHTENELCRSIHSAVRVQTEQKDTFCSYDLDLMTLKYEFEVDILKMYVDSENEDCWSRLSKVEMHRLSAVLPIIGISRFVHWYQPSVIFALCGLHVAEIKAGVCIYVCFCWNMRVASISGKSGCVL